MRATRPILRNSRTSRDRWRKIAALATRVVVLSALPAATLAATPKLGGWKDNGTSPLAGLGQLALSLIAIVALILIMAWLFRRVRGIGPGSGAPLRVVGQLSLSGKERVVLVEAGDKQLLLGVAPGRVQTLHVLDEPIELPTAPTATKTFGDILDSIRSRGRKS